MLNQSVSPFPLTGFRPGEIFFPSGHPGKSSPYLKDKMSTPLVQSEENQQFSLVRFSLLQRQSSGKPPFPLTGFRPGENLLSERTMRCLETDRARTHRSLSALIHSPGFKCQ